MIKARITQRTKLLKDNQKVNVELETMLYAIPPMDSHYQHHFGDGVTKLEGRVKFQQYEVTETEQGLEQVISISLKECQSITPKPTNLNTTFFDPDKLPKGMTITKIR